MRYGSVVNHIIANNYKDNKIKVGMGVTEIMWSDRHAFFIKEIITDKKGNPKELKLEGAWLKALGEGCYDVSKEYKKGYFQSYKEMTIKRTRKGTWTDTGTVDGQLFRIGHAEEYYDICF